MRRSGALPGFFKPYLYITAGTLALGAGLALWALTVASWKEAGGLVSAYCALLIGQAALLWLLTASLRRRVEAITDYAGRLSDGGRIGHRRDDDDLFRSLADRVAETASRLEERIRTAEEGRNRLAAILESMSEGVIVVDTDERIVIMNSTLAQALGAPRSGLEGRSYWEVVRDPEINEMLRVALERRQAARREHSPLLTHSVFQITVSPVSGPFGYLGIIAVFYDVTKIKEYERLRSEFVANVSHELKTPLTSILGFVETLKEGAVEDHENRGRFLQIIEDHARSLHEMIEDLLQLSRMESSADPVRKESSELRPLVDRLIESLAPALRTRRITIERRIPEGARIRADVKTLERALLNLVDNAVKYNHDGGQIIIGYSETDGESVIEVGDTGIGIAEPDLARVFERFYRVDKSRSRESGGTGLGLSIVKHIVERHGGRIQARSLPGKGSTFTIFLPKI
ncbi:MAG: Alkaline phosphatase synthesis sensor protein PhoR [Candidatus Omnitrophica bacterium]|nr:Alkaline phosphatase synthesis sensor protein PhoR [Candidatus Omnitrophota bacterium]